MTGPDLINGTYELFGAVAILASIRAIRRTQAVAGYSAMTLLYFTSWGLWNLYYYPHLKQTMSLVGAVSTALANLVYLGHLVYYSRRQA